MLSFPIWLAQTAIRDPRLWLAFSLQTPTVQSPMIVHQVVRPQKLVTFRVRAATVPSDTQEGRWDIKVTSASGGFREPWQAPGHLS